MYFIYIFSAERYSAGSSTLTTMSQQNPRALLLNGSPTGIFSQELRTPPRSCPPLQRNAIIPRRMISHITRVLIEFLIYIVDFKLCSTVFLGGFESMVIEKLDFLAAALTQLTNTVNMMANQRESRLVTTNGTEYLIPILTHEDFENLEKILANSEKKTAFVS